MDPDRTEKTATVRATATPAPIQCCGWSFDGQLRRRNGRPVVLPGLWGIAFGNGAMAGPRTTLFFSAGPHRWRGASELAVHGLLGAISPAQR